MVNGGLVAFPCFSLRLLGAPAKLPHHAPDMAGMIAHAGLMGDDLGDPGKAPQVGVEAIGPGTFEESGFDLFESGGGKSRLASGATGSGQCFFAVLLPSGEPDTDRLAGNTQLARHFGLGNSLFEKCGRGESPFFHPSEIAPGPVGLKDLSFHAYIIDTEKKIVKVLCGMGVRHKW